MNTFIVVLCIKTTTKELPVEDSWWKKAVFNGTSTEGESAEVMSIVRMKEKTDVPV